MDRALATMYASDMFGFGRVRKDEPQAPALPAPVAYDPVPLDSRPVPDAVTLRAPAGADDRGDLPRFRSDAADQALPGSGSSGLSQVRARLRHAFAATQPVQNRSQLVGRWRELEALISAISEQRAHALIYGPRGYGKTSLVRTFGELADQAHHVVVYTSCSHGTDFSALFRPYLAEVPLEYSSRRAAPGLTGKTLAALLPETFSARQLAEVLGTIDGTRVIFILDEYDRIEDTEIQRGVAELVKDLSDLQARTHLVLVGVASNVQQLLGFHPSIHRNLVCVGIRRLDEAGARGVLQTGAAEAGITVAPDAADAVAAMAMGSAYHVRLLGLAAGLAALAEDRTEIDLPTLKKAARQVVSDWSPLDPPGAALAQRLCADEALRRLIEAISIACLSNDDHFTAGDAATVYAARFAGGDRGAIARRIGSWCKAMAGTGQVLRLVADGSAGASIYEFANHLTPEFLLMAAWSCEA